MRCIRSAAATVTFAALAAIAGCSNGDDDGGNTSDQTAPDPVTYEDALACDSFSPDALASLAESGALDKDPTDTTDERTHTWCQWGEFRTGSLVATYTFADTEDAKEQPDIVHRDREKITGFDGADEAYVIIDKDADAASCTAAARDDNAVVIINYQPTSYDAEDCRDVATTLLADFAGKNFR